VIGRVCVRRRLRAPRYRGQGVTCVPVSLPEIRYLLPSLPLWVEADTVLTYLAWAAGRRRHDRLLHSSRATRNDPLIAHRAE
jgi:hypothetical protein